MDATYTQQNTLPENDVILNPVFSSGVKDLARTISNYPTWTTLNFVACYRALIRWPSEPWKA